MATNVSVQFNGVFLPNIILLTLLYYQRGIRLNATKRFAFAAYVPTQTFWQFFPLSRGCSEWLDAFSLFLTKMQLRNVSDLSIDKVPCCNVDEGNLQHIEAVEDLEITTGP